MKGQNKNFGAEVESKVGSIRAGRQMTDQMMTDDDRYRQIIDTYMKDDR